MVCTTKLNVLLWISGVTFINQNECDSWHPILLQYIFNQGYCDDLVDRLDTFEERYRGPINEKDNQVVRVSKDSVAH